MALTDSIDRETVQLFRSKEMLARKERETRGEDTPALIAEERVRMRRHGDELRRLLRAACLTGRIYFRGNDRSPGDRAMDVGKTAAEVLGHVLPEVFDRFKEAAAKAADVKKGTDALFTAENLQGLPSVFGGLGLLRDEKGKTVFRTESGPLKEVLDRIDERANYGDTASGRYLADEFAKEPFGWDFEVVRLLALSLLRSGKIEATSKGQTIDTVTGVDARDTFSNNNLFRQAAFRPKKGIEFEELVKASEAFRDTFGSEVKELNAGAIVAELRKEVARHEDTVSSALATLTAHRLPGNTVLDSAIGQMKAILRGSEDNAIATFNTSHRGIKDAIKRAVELEQVLSEPRLSRPRARAQGAGRALELLEPRAGHHGRAAHARRFAPGSARARDVLQGAAQHRATHEGHGDRVRAPRGRGARRPGGRVHQCVREAHQDSRLVGYRRGPAAPPRRAHRPRNEAWHRASAHSAASCGSRRVRGAPARCRVGAEAPHRR